MHGMEGMGGTAPANSLYNKFKWMKEHYYSEALDNPTSLLYIQGREIERVPWLWPHHLKREDGEFGTNITTTHTISFKRYLIVFYEEEMITFVFQWETIRRVIR